MLGKSCYHTSISGFLYSLSTGTVDSPISFFVCLSRQVNCNDFSSPAPSLAFPTRCLWFRLRRLLSYQMCVRAEGKKDLSFLISLRQIVILSDYFRGFPSEVVATGLQEAHNLSFRRPTVKGEAGTTTEVEVETGM